MRSFLGIDWGTHSSKWVYQHEHKSGAPIIGEMWDSGVSRIENDLVFFPLENRARDIHRETGLKRKLIQDPDQSFWDGPRPKLGVTLGEAVVFSILSLLLDAERVIKRKKLSLRGTSLTVRFSHPNWIEDTNIRALQCFRDAAVVALNIFLGQGSPQKAAEIRFQVDALRRSVAEARRLLTDLRDFPEMYIHSQFQKCIHGDVGAVQWSLVFESCAAGFPYLIDGEQDIFEEDLRKLSVNRRIRKILVVDVGAGSTDSGYLIRTVRPRDSQKIMRPLLLWLPAANALEVAGRWLTDKILFDMKQQGRRVTPVEAEQFKITQAHSWIKKPYLREWCGLISDSVGEYVSGIRDDVCLPKEPNLEVVVTGGSSAVEPMRTAVLDKVRGALKDRGCAAGANMLKVASLKSVASGYREVQIAQLAVALGASDPYLSELKSYPEGLLTTPS